MGDWEFMEYLKEKEQCFTRIFLNIDINSNKLTTDKQKNK